MPQFRVRIYFINVILVLNRFVKAKMFRTSYTRKEQVYVFHNRNVVEPIDEGNIPEFFRYNSVLKKLPH